MSTPYPNRDPRTNMQQPFVTDEDWADIDRKLTYGFVTPDGKFVPGILQNIEQLTQEIARSRQVDAWILRLLLIIAVVRFIGVDHAQDIIHFFMKA